MRNLLLMTGLQVLVYFNSLLLTYLTTLFSQVYLTGLVSAASEIGAYIFSGMTFEKFGVRRTYFINLTIAIIGGVLIIFHGLDN